MTTPAVPPDDPLAESFRNGSRADAMASKPDTWTRWFDVDTPTSGYNNGDYETVYRIQRTFKICDKDYEIAAAECYANEDPLNTFTEQTPRNLVKDYLQRFCTTEGLVCTNEDQPEGSICQDYSVRFRCHYIGDKDNNGSYPQFDVRIYIILAVVPILIFLLRMLWTFVCRRRRQQRRNERRARQRLNRANGDDLDDDSSSVGSAVANPPPSYQELFGKTGHATSGSSVFAISRDNIPICLHCQRNSCSVASIIGKQRSLQHSAAIGQFMPSDTSAVSEQGLLNQPMGSAISRQQQTESTNDLVQQSDEPETSIENSDIIFPRFGVDVSNPSLGSADVPISFSAPSEAHCSPSAPAEGASSPSVPTEESRSPSVTVENPDLHQDLKKALDSPSSLSEIPSSPSKLEPRASLTSIEEPSSPLASDEAHISPATPIETLNSPSVSTEMLNLPLASTETSCLPLASTNMPNSPSAVTETSNVPLVLTEMTSSPLTPTEIVSSPLTEINNSPFTPTEITNSPLAPTEMSNSPLAPSEITSSPLNPTAITNSPLAPSEITSSPLNPSEIPNSLLEPIEMPNSHLAPTEITNSHLAPTEITNSPLTQTEMSYPHSILTEASQSSPASIEPLSPQQTSKEASNFPSTPTKTFNSSTISTEAPFSPVTPTASTSSEASQEIIIDITEVNSTNGSSSETTVLDITSFVDTQSEAHSAFNTDNLHTGNNQDQVNPQNSISDALQASASQSSSLASSDLTLSLNPSFLNPGDISDPCACPCHRTIPLKHQGAAGYDNQGYAFDGDVEGSRHLSYPGMHIPAFGFHRVWSDLSVASSIGQTDLPTYEVAIELINEKKTKEAESQTPSN